MIIKTKVAEVVMIARHISTFDININIIITIMIITIMIITIMIITIMIITIMIIIIMMKVTDLAMITPHVGTFDTAQRRVLNLLQNDAFPRFLRST